MKVDIVCSLGSDLSYNCTEGTTLWAHIRGSMGAKFLADGAMAISNHGELYNLRLQNAGKLCVYKSVLVLFNPKVVVRAE